VATAEIYALTARISAAASEAFGTPIAHMELQKLKIDLTALPLEFIEPAMALDLSGILVPIINMLTARSIVIGFTLRQVKGLVNDWLMKNFYQVDERLINWLDKVTKSLTASMSKRLEDLEREILDAVAKGRNKRDAGEAAISQRIQELERQHSKLTGVLEFSK
jgi:hypothetical protein